MIGLRKLVAVYWAIRGEKLDVGPAKGHFNWDFDAAMYNLPR